MISDYNRRGGVVNAKNDYEKQKMIYNYQKKVHNLQFDGIWITDDFLQAAARHFEKPIVVIAEAKGRVYVKQEYEAAFNTTVQELDRSILYIHHTGNHFNYLLHNNQEAVDEDVQF